MAPALPVQVAAAALRRARVSRTRVPPSVMPPWAMVRPDPPIVGRDSVVRGQRVGAARPASTPQVTAAAPLVPRRDRESAAPERAVTPDRRPATWAARRAAPPA